MSDIPDTNCSKCGSTLVHCLQHVGDTGRGCCDECRHYLTKAPPAPDPQEKR